MDFENELNSKIDKLFSELYKPIYDCYEQLQQLIQRVAGELHKADARHDQMKKEFLKELLINEKLQEKSSKTFKDGDLTKNVINSNPPVNSNYYDSLEKDAGSTFMDKPISPKEFNQCQPSSIYQHFEELSDNSDSIENDNQSALVEFSETNGSSSITIPNELNLKNFSSCNDEIADQPDMIANPDNVIPIQTSDKDLSPTTINYNNDFDQTMNSSSDQLNEVESLNLQTNILPENVSEILSQPRNNSHEDLQGPIPTMEKNQTIINSSENLSLSQLNPSIVPSDGSSHLSNIIKETDSNQLTDESMKEASKCSFTITPPKTPSSKEILEAKNVHQNTAESSSFNSNCEIQNVIEKDDTIQPTINIDQKESDKEIKGQNIIGGEQSLSDNESHKQHCFLGETSQFIKNENSNDSYSVDIWDDASNQTVSTNADEYIVVDQLNSNDENFTELNGNNEKRVINLNSQENQLDNDHNKNLSKPVATTLIEKQEDPFIYIKQESNVKSPLQTDNNTQIDEVQPNLINNCEPSLSFPIDIPTDGSISDNQLYSNSVANSQSTKFPESQKDSLMNSVASEQRNKEIVSHVPTNDNQDIIITDIKEEIDDFTFETSVPTTSKIKRKKIVLKTNRSPSPELSRDRPKRKPILPPSPRKSEWYQPRNIESNEIINTRRTIIQPPKSSAPCQSNPFLNNESDLRNQLSNQQKNYSRAIVDSGSSGEISQSSRKVVYDVKEPRLKRLPSHDDSSKNDPTIDGLLSSAGLKRTIKNNEYSNNESLSPKGKSRRLANSYHDRTVPNKHTRFYICDFCKMQFHSKPEFDQHKSEHNSFSHRSMKGYKKKCGYRNCEFVAKSRSEMRHHNKEQHSNHVAPAPPQKDLRERLSKRQHEPILSNVVPHISTSSQPQSESIQHNFTPPYLLPSPPITNNSGPEIPQHGPLCNLHHCEQNFTDPVELYKHIRTSHAGLPDFNNYQNPHQAHQFNITDLPIPTITVNYNPKPQIRATCPVKDFGCNFTYSNISELHHHFKLNHSI